jgi:hypothetical protein
VEHVSLLANMSIMEPRALWIVGLLALLNGHGQQRKPVTAGGARFALLQFGESRKRVTGTEKAGEFVAALVAIVVSWMGAPSQVLYVVVAGACMLFALDYSTAHRAARLAGEAITTRKIREMTSAKILSYWITGMAFTCVGLMLRSWLPITGIFGWIAYCEAVSNLENLRKMALASGQQGSLFFRGVLNLANKFLGELPGAREALGTDIKVSQTITTDKTTTTDQVTTTQTDTQVHVSPAPLEQKVGTP